MCAGLERLDFREAKEGLKAHAEAYSAGNSKGFRPIEPDGFEYV